MTEEQAALIKKAQESLRAAELLMNDGLYDFSEEQAARQIQRARKFLELGNNFLS